MREYFWTKGQLQYLMAGWGFRPDDYQLPTKSKPLAVDLPEHCSDRKLTVRVADGKSTSGGALFCGVFGN